MFWDHEAVQFCGVMKHLTKFCFKACHFVCAGSFFFWWTVFSTNGELLVWVGGLDSWNPLMKRSVTWVYP